MRLLPGLQRQYRTPGQTWRPEKAVAAMIRVGRQSQVHCTVSRYINLCVVGMLGIAGCAGLQTPPPQVIPGPGGQQGDAGWARVLQVKPGQEIFMYVNPPVEARDGLELQTRRGDPPPSGPPPYDAPLEFWAELVSVSDDEIVLHPKDPVVIPRARVRRLAVHNKGERSTGLVHGALRGAPAGLLLGAVVAGATDDTSAGVIAGAAFGGAIALAWVRYRPASPARVVLYRVPTQPRR